MKDIENLSIKKIGLSTRCLHALLRRQVTTVGMLFNCTEELLHEIPQLGRKSVDEILQKIEEYRQLAQAEDTCETDGQTSCPETGAVDFEEWLLTEEGKDFACAFFRENTIGVDALEQLSVKAYNLLAINEYVSFDQIAFCPEEELLHIPRMEPETAGEIRRVSKDYLQAQKSALMVALGKKQAEKKLKETSILDLIQMPQNKDTVLRYVEQNNYTIGVLDLSNRAKSRLQLCGFHKLSQIVFMTKNDFLQIHAMGEKSAQDIEDKIHAYLSEHESRIRRMLTGDGSVIITDEDIRRRILSLYQNIGFAGLNYRDFAEKLRLPEIVTEERLKKAIGSLIAAGELEYVDFYCYRVYGKFRDWLERCPEQVVSEQKKDIIRRRLTGETLENIAQTHSLTKERIRQIVARYSGKICEWHSNVTGLNLFDEDYYRYFYQTYEFDKNDAERWFGISQETYYYLDLLNRERGKQDLSLAVADENLCTSAGLLLKINNYLNRNNISIDGVGIPAKRTSLEEYVICHFCRENVSFNEFAEMYNNFLREQEIPYNENLYYTKDVLHARKNHLSRANFVLWSQNEQLRFYDIEAQDFTQFLIELNLESYENTELSTLKLMNDYPALMKKYDIRNQYELHNLLKKIVPSGSYHDFHCERSPIIRFGEFDRESAIFELMIDNAPLSVDELVDLVYREYGYDRSTTQRTYLPKFNVYCHQGVYTIDQKEMSANRRVALKQLLTDDFYYTDDVRRLYKKAFSDADPEEVNPYNLKQMGFQVYSRYILQNWSSLEEFFRSMLTGQELLDLTPCRNRYWSVPAFYQTLSELKRAYQVVEYEPKKIIQIRRLESAGITRELLCSFCNGVYQFMQEGSYFSAKSLRVSGFQSELYELGFSDWFYASILAADERFSFCMAFNAIILHKGKADVTIRSFAVDLIQKAGQTDVYDLISKMEKTFGCLNVEKSTLLLKIQNTDVYYDPILGRLYADAEEYYNELDNAGNL